MKKDETVNQRSRAPYNFVPLNEKVVTSENLPDFDRYHLERYTGYIELEIEALTPLYIRDTLNDLEFKERLKNEEERKKNKIPPYANPEFFSPGGLIRIPGSSLRGMIRTLVEIVSFGKFLIYDDRRLYYRSFADMCIRLREEYMKNMNQRAGILVKEGTRHSIIETSYIPVPKEEARRLLESIGEEYKDFSIYGPLEYKGIKDGYLVVSGPMRGRKYDYFIEPPKDESRREDLSWTDILNYKNDRERRAKIDLLKYVEENGRAPCFFTRYEDSKGEKRIAFGHTLWFRIPYKKTIGDHVKPDSLKDPQTLDIPEAIFGKESSHASRVFFEDFFLLGPEDPLLEEASPKILSSPKPTCFQHYLKQYQHNLKDFPKNLAHYNDLNPIRGYKLYWHRDASDWVAEKKDVESHKTQYTRIKPVVPGSVFKGTIRFENLSKVELGALLFVLELPEGLAHKLGMAKPHGLGSVRIKPKLYLSDRSARYRDLFHEWDTEMRNEESTDEFKKAFESYILEKLSEKFESLWDHPRIRKLKRILEFEKRPSNEKTRYLEIERRVNGKKVNEYRSRPVLPEPEDVA